jgi:ribonucleoside-diphosphate reductase alpha chain
MVKGLPYDSNEARAVGGAITAIMTGQAYATSAEIAGEKGTFNGFEVNREPMLNVMRMHRASVEKIDSNYCPDYLQTAARTDWDRAIQLGEKNGYRNAQATVLAPTGTIGLLMDCDTTGVEPDYSLVKYKKLAGGGYFKIINQSIPRALKSLGYSSDEVLDIISYVIGSGSLSNAPHINTAALKKSGFTDQQIAEAEEDIKRFQGLNEFVRHVNPKELEKAGFNRQQIREARKYINGAETIEGAPHLKKEEYAIFDTANKCGDGIRFIAPMGHVRMMAAVQPFLSGAISKTVNLPAETTVDDIRDVYTKAWELGLKSIAIYRDGSKGSQIYNNASSDDEKTTDEDHKKKQDELLKEALKNIVERGEKVSLPTRRKGYTYSANIGGQKIFFRTGEYEDGKLGEIFVDMFKAGASYKSLLNCFAVSVSLGLQYGVPLERFVEKFVFTRFEPAGFTDHPHVRSATSVLDFIFRVLAVDYLGRYDLAHTPPKIADDTSYNVAKDMQVKQEEEKEESRGYATSMDDHLHEMDGDAPPCDLCGHITVRNGACYKCVNCGNSLGCS